MFDSFFHNTFDTLTLENEVEKEEEEKEGQCVSVTPLSSTWITSVFITIRSLEIVQFVANLAMITVLKCSGLSHAFRCVVESTKMLFTSLGRSVSGKTVPSDLSTNTSGTIFPIRTSWLVNNLYVFDTSIQRPPILSCCCHFFAVVRVLFIWFLTSIKRPANYLSKQNGDR